LSGVAGWDELFGHGFRNMALRVTRGGANRPVNRAWQDGCGDAEWQPADGQATRSHRRPSRPAPAPVAAKAPLQSRPSPLGQLVALPSAKSTPRPSPKSALHDSPAHHLIPGGMRCLRRARLTHPLLHHRRPLTPAAAMSMPPRAPLRPCVRRHPTSNRPAPSPPQYDRACNVSGCEKRLRPTPTDTDPCGPQRERF